MVYPWISLSLCFVQFCIRESDFLIFRGTFSTSINIVTEIVILCWIIRRFLYNLFIFALKTIYILFSVHLLLFIAILFLINSD